MRILVPYAFALVCLSGCAGLFPVVGFDGSGKAIERKINGRRYIDRMSGALATLERTVVPVLASWDGEEEHWKLRTAVLGFGVKVSGGIGPFKVAIKPGVRVAFGNGNNPPIP